MKRILSMLTAILLVLSMVPAVSFAAESVTVYMDPQKGNNANSGTEASPVQDFEGAYALLQNSGGTVVMLSDITFNAVYTLPACDYPVTVTSKTGAEGIRSNSHVLIAGDTTFQNMSFTLLKESTGTTICGCGYQLTMGEGVTIVPFMKGTSPYYFCLQGGDPNKAVASTDLTVRSGYYRYLYAGGYTQNVTGDVKLTMTGGTASNLAVCRTGDVSGNVTMNFSGTATVTGALYAGAATSGNLKGSCTVTFGQGAQFKNFYAGSNGSGSITGTTTVICDGFDGTFTAFKGKGGSSSTGTTGGSRLLLKSGTLTKAPTDFGAVAIEIPTDKTFTLACDLSADTVSGAGTLVFSGAASLTAGAVSGTVNCETADQALQNHVYVTAPAGAGIVFSAQSGVQEYSGKWECRDLSAFQGLVLKTDPANKIILYTGLWRSGDTDTHTEVTPYLTETLDGVAYYYYPNARGTFYVRGTRSGYIGVYQNIYMSPEEAAAKTVETVTLEKKGTGGYVPSNVYINTSEVMEKEETWKSELSMFPEEYTRYMQNPTFREDRDAHRMTTGEELEAELAAMDRPDDHMYRYSLGTSLQGREIPLVIFTETDLSGAKTQEAAAAALANSHKLTVYYRAQMHGNEPAGGEGALAMLYKLQSGYVETLLDQINLIIVPRLNPDGSYAYQRRLTDSNTTDPNRDQLRLNTKEMQLLQKSYLLFDPEVMIDGHERMWNNPLGDMQISTGFGPMHSDTFRKLSLELNRAAFQSLENAGLNGYYYTGKINTSSGVVGGGYYPLAGSLYVLMESRGIHESDEAMERRVVGHMASATGLLNYLHSNAQTVKATVEAERAAIAKRGETYEEDELFALDTNDRKTTDADEALFGELNTLGQTINWATGEVTYPVRYPTVGDQVDRSRPAPTAYVIGANLPNADVFLSVMDMHGIAYTYLPEGATLSVQRYEGTTTLASLGEETQARFAGGCYVFTMNQEKGLLLATLMEPDNVDTHHEESTGNLAMSGLLGVSDTYRYIRDLNAEGFVDYTVTEADPVNITVWLDGTNGDDTADGLTEETAVKTMETAYSILDTAMAGAPAGSKATVKILGMYELGTARVSMPKVSFHVTITGKTTADGISYTGGSTQETRIIDLNGPTTLEYMTLHSNSGGSYNHLNANGHKLVIGEGVNCTTKGANRYFTLAGGGYASATHGSTDLTVRSGKWRTIYAGGYLTHVTGQAKADISGCWVYQNIAPSYRGNVGSVDLRVANVTVNDAVTNAGIYAGPTQRKNTSQGEIFGDVTITLGENVNAWGVYAASCNEGVIRGTVTVIADGVDLSRLPVYARQTTTTGTVGAVRLVLNTDVTQNITLDAALPLDLGGYDITGNLTVDGTLTVYDSATDDYDVSDGKYGEITGTVSGNLQAAEGYVAAGGGFHRFGGQYISSVSLRPSNAGIYYTATFLADEVLLSEMETGVAVSLTDLPGADFATDADTLYTKGTTGVMVQNILKGDSEDADRAIMDIYAASYVKLPDGTVLVSDANIAYSLYDVLLLIREQNPEAFATFCEAYNITNWF